MTDASLIRNYGGGSEIGEFKKKQMKDLSFVRQEARNLIEFDRQRMMQRGVEKNKYGQDSGGQGAKWYDLQREVIVATKIQRDLARSNPKSVLPFLNEFSTVNPKHLLRY